MQSPQLPRSRPPNKALQQATCAAILAASLAGPLAADASQALQHVTTASVLAASVAIQASTLETLQKYCISSWRLAGITERDWEDCTQEVMVELLSRVSRDRVASAIENPDTLERRDLIRSIWCVTQRWRRARMKQPVSLAHLADTELVQSPESYDGWTQLQPAIETLNTTQQQILKLLRRGDSIAEIAEQLNVPAARVSDQKYKAVKKLQKTLAV